MFWKKKKELKDLETENNTLVMWHKYPIFCADHKVYEELTKFFDKKEPFVVLWCKIKGSRLFKQVKKIFCSHSWYEFRNYENYTQEGHEVHDYHVCRKCRKEKLLNIEIVTYGSE